MLLSKKIAYGGIVIALIMLFITFSYMSPIADFALFSLCSLCVSLEVYKFGIKAGIMVYTGASILIFAIFGPLYALPFVALFGLYPILKDLIEKRFKQGFAYIFKALYFAVVIISALFIFLENLTKMGFLRTFERNDTIFKLIISFLGIIILLVYDYALTLMISFIGKRLDNKG